MPGEAFILKDGKKNGPFTASQLRQLAAAGEIGPEDLIKRDPNSLPVPARTIAGLIESFGTGSVDASSPSDDGSPDWIGEVLDQESGPHAADTDTISKAPSTEEVPARPNTPAVRNPSPAPPGGPGDEPSWLTTERVPPNFDPYHIWLGIPKGKRPPTHYQLLRISPAEHADEVIEATAERQSAYVRKCRIGEYAKLADQLLYEIEEARHCLLKPHLRKEYDEKLADGKPKPPSKLVTPPPTKIVGESNEIVRTYLGAMSVLVGGFLVMALVTFLLPWKKVVFSQTSAPQPVADDIVAANPQAAGNAPNANANVPANVLPPGNAAAAVPAGASAPRKALGRPNGPKVGRAKAPKPELLVNPFDEVAAKESQKKWSAYLQSPVELTNSIGMKLILVPAGDFMMGSDDQRLPENARPVHRVRINKPLYFGVYEVTQEQFEKVMGFNPSHFSDDPQRPCDSVSLTDDLSFLRRLGDVAEENLAGRRYRLPTEAEWEFACRAGTTTLFHFGDEIKVDEANFNGRNGEEQVGPGLGRTAKVGSYAPNAFGLFDMHGNVVEVVSDWYSAGYYAVSPVDDPQGPESGERGVGRGGGWNNPAIPSAYRFHGPRSTIDAALGFRVVCEIKPAEDARPAAPNKPVAPADGPAKRQRATPPAARSSGL
jgi:formylglycine-generating enzyme required for sulfatase activity